MGFGIGAPAIGMANHETLPDDGGGGAAKQVRAPNESILLVIAWDGTIRVANEAAHETLGYSPPLLVGRTIESLLAEPSDRLRERIFATGERRGLRLAMRSEEQSRVALVINRTTMLDAQGNPEAIILTGGEESVQEPDGEDPEGENTRLRAQLETAIDGILVLSDQREVILANSRFGEMWGLPEELLTATDGDDVLLAAVERLEDPGAFLTRAAQLHTHRTAVGRDEIELEDGRTFDWRSLPLVDRDDHYHGRIWYFRDVTEFKQTVEALKQRRREVEKLSIELTHIEERQRREISEALHDCVSQNLVAAKIKAGMLQNTALPEDAKPMVAEILAMLDSVVRDVAALTFELYPPLLYEAGLIAALDWLLCQYAKRHGLKCILRERGGAPDLPENALAPLFLSVRELLTNVVKHAGASQVVVSLGVSEEILTISVEDDGVGDAHTISPNGAGEAGGFGVFAIRQRLRHLGGFLETGPAPGGGHRAVLTVSLESSGEEAAEDAEGTKRKAGGEMAEPANAALVHEMNEVLTVVLALGSLLENQLPADGPTRRDARGIISAAQKACDIVRHIRGTVDEGQVAAPTARSGQKAGKGEVSPRGPILIVDDDPSILQVGRRVLESLGYDVLLAEGGAAGLELFAQHHNEISLVILDMVMPEIDGPACFRRMREIAAEIPILLCTGADRKADIESLQRDGAAGWLRKPFLPGEMAGAISAATAARSAEHQPNQLPEGTSS